MIPSVKIEKSDFQTGVVRAGAIGTLAIIASAGQGDANLAQSFSDPNDVLTEYGDSPLTEIAALDMAHAQKPVVCVRPTASTAAVIGTPTQAGVGSSDVTASGTPLDYFDVLVTFTTGGTGGTAGIVYTYSLDGGKNTSAKQALGTALSFVIPRSGITITIETAETVLSGQTFAARTTPALMNNTDLTTALAALKASTAQWDALIVDAAIDSTMLGTINTWIAGLRSEGKSKTFFVNTRCQDAGESAATFASAMATALGSARGPLVGCVGYGFAWVTSPLRGLRFRRPVALAAAAHAMRVDMATDLNNRQEGPLTFAQISDDAGNPKWHNEVKNPGADDLGFVTLMQEDGDGVYVTNPNLYSPSGSDYVYLQQARVINRCEEICYQVLKGQLSIGIETKNGKITEGEASRLESLCNRAMAREMLGDTRRANATRLVLSRNDDLSSNSGATLTGKIEVNPLKYVKKFELKSVFSDLAVSA